MIQKESGEKLDVRAYTEVAQPTSSGTFLTHRKAGHVARWVRGRVPQSDPRLELYQTKASTLPRGPGPVGRVLSRPWGCRAGHLQSPPTTPISRFLAPVLGLIEG